MTPQAINIAIAQSCGHQFEITDVCPFCKGNTPYESGDDYGIPLWSECTRCNNTGKVASRYVGLRNYCGDLNEMHEAEKALGDKEDYYHIVLRRVCKAGTPGAIKATAAQRAEAFARTVNIWIE